MRINKFRSIILSGGNYCFVKCPGCYNYFGKKDYNTEDLLSFLRELKKYINIEKVTVAGGDPLIRDDISYLLKEIKKMDFYINLDTVGLSLIRDVQINGRFTVKRILPQNIIPYVDLVGIPLDGSYDNIIQLFRRKLFLKDILDILNVLDKCKAKVCINTVVHKGNVDDILNIHSIITNYRNIVKWQLFQFMPIGPGGYRNRTVYEISDSTFSEVRENLIKYKSDHPMKIQFKSKSERKNKYLLIDGEGIIWIPKQNCDLGWNNNDSNGERVILGNINNKHEYNQIINNLICLKGR